MVYGVKEKQVRDWRQEKDTLIISAAYTRNNSEILIFVSKKGCVLYSGAAYNPGKYGTSKYIAAIRQCYVTQQNKS